MAWWLAIVAALALTGCDETSEEQVAWAASPDRRTHAIVTEINGGATTSYGYRVHLHPAEHAGERPVAAGFLYEATRSECSYGINLHWRDPRTLEIRYLTAEMIDVPPSVVVGDRTIRLVLRSGARDPTADCGAMVKT